MKVPQHELIATIHDQLARAKRILVVTHLRPDGDAIGSVLAIGLPLIAAGKDVQMVLSDGVPEKFLFLDGSELIKTKPEGEVDYRIVVDSAELERTDSALSEYGQADLNIDHHITNTNFARLNLIEPEAVATAELLTRYLPDFGLSITRPVADVLLLGIITDTIGFRTTNVSSETFRMVAGLMDLGGKLTDIYYRTIVEQSLAAARYWGAGLSKINMKDGLVWTTLSLQERNQAGYLSSDDADLVKVLSAIEGSKIAVILTEQSPGYVKISWRLCGSESTELDVSAIAQKFGGGGHKAAAGADVKGNMDDVLGRVLAETRVSLGQIKHPVEEI